MPLLTQLIARSLFGFWVIKYVSPTAQQVQRYQLRAGDIRFSHINSPEQIGKAALFNCQHPLIHGINLLLLRADKARCYPAYLEALLESSGVRLYFRMRCKRAVNQASLNQEDILSLQIRLPCLRDQERIAEQLEQADQLRCTRRYALELTDTFLPAAFLELFGDPFAVPSAELARLEDVLEVAPQNGLYVSADRYVANSDPKGTEMVHMSDLFGGIVTPGSLKRALLETSEVAKYQLSERDLLVARRSLAYEGAAQPCRIPALDTSLAFESSMIRIRPDRSRMLPVYLYYYLTNRAVRENRVRRYVTISTISGINQDNLCRIEVVVPPLTLQQKFATLVERVECVRVVQREALRQAEHLFASLLQRAFSI